MCKFYAGNEELIVFEMKESTKLLRCLWEFMNEGIIPLKRFEGPLDCVALAELWVFGSKHAIPKLQNEAMKHICRHCTTLDQQGWSPFFKFVKIAREASEEKVDVKALVDIAHNTLRHIGVDRMLRVKYTSTSFKKGKLLILLEIPDEEDVELVKRRPLGDFLVKTITG
jgi:hypothetical protein